jgi:hypothetical protein
VLSAVNDLYSPVLLVPSDMPGVFSGEEGSADELPGVEVHDVAVIPKPIGVDLGGSQVEAVFDNAAFDTAVDVSLKQQAVAEINEGALPKAGMAARNACIRNLPKQYVPSMQGNKYQVASAQITTSLGMSDISMAYSQMSVKLMSEGIHQRADIVGMVMAQVLLKAALKKWGREAEESVGKEMKQLHWQNSFKPMHWKSLTAEQRKKVLESHIFVERKHDGLLKARQVAGGNKQQGYIIKEDASSSTVSSEAVMLTCAIDATKKRDVAVVDIPNAFIQTVVEDEKDRAFICIRGPLVDILMSIAPDVYGSYVTVGKKGEKQLLVQCLTTLFGTMVALLLYYKKFVKSLKSKGFRLNPYDPCVANKQVKGEQLTVCFHVNDCKISHLIPKVIDETFE